MFSSIFCYLPRWKNRIRWILLLSIISWNLAIFFSQAQGSTKKSVLIVYHGGDPSQSSSPSLDAKVDAFTHATTQGINVENVGRELQRRLEFQGFQVTFRRVETLQQPQELLNYDIIIIGSPVWFTNVSYPIKKFFDTHLIRIYENRQNRLNDKVMSAFLTVMEQGECGPRALQVITWAIEQLTNQKVEGIVIQTSESEKEWKRKVEALVDRITKASQSNSTRK